MATRADITPELCRQLLRYEPDTGRLFWRARTPDLFADTGVGGREGSCARWNGRYTDAPALSAVCGGYFTGRIFDLSFSAHRVVWAIVYGEWPPVGLVVDHINGNPQDNRITNLRVVSHTANGRNCKQSKSNRTGRTGVSFSKREGKWVAYIHDGKRRNLGYFNDYASACAAREAAERQVGYHPNHGRL